jgi:hypothetical protein
MFEKFLFLRIYIDPTRITDQLKTHLTGIQIKDYQSVFEDVTIFSRTKKVWVSPMSSYAIYKAVENKVLNEFLKLQILKIFI